MFLVECAFPAVTAPLGDSNLNKELVFNSVKTRGTDAYQ